MNIKWHSHSFVRMRSLTNIASSQRIPIQSSLETESNGRRISRDNNMTSSLQVQGATRVELCYISINMHFKIGTSSVKDTIKTSQIPLVLH